MPLATLPPPQGTTAPIGDDAATSESPPSSSPLDSGDPESGTATVPALPLTTAPGPPPATTVTTATTPDSSTSGTGPTITYRITNPTGALATLTTNGAVYIIPAGPSISLAPSLVVTVTVPPGLDTDGVDIEAVKAAYRGYVEVGDKATHDPTRDWSASFAEYTAQPFLSTVLDQVASMARAGQRSLGHASYVATLTSAGPDLATLSVCNDVSGLDRVDSVTGISVKVDMGDKHAQDVTIRKSADKKWLVSDVRGHIEVTC